MSINITFYLILIIFFIVIFLYILKYSKIGLYLCIFFLIVQFQLFEFLKKVQKFHPLLVLIFIIFFSIIFKKSYKKELLFSYPYRSRKLIISILLFMVYSILSICYSVDITTSITILKTLLRSFFTFIIIVALISSKKDAINLSKIIVMSCFILILFNLYNILNYSNLSPYYIDKVYGKYLRFVPSASYDPNEFSVILNLNLPLIFYFWNISKKKLIKLLYVLILFLNIISIIMTLSRTGFINMIFVLISSSFVFFKKYKKYLVIFILLIFIVSNILINEGNLVRFKKMREIGILQEENVSNRIYSFYIALKIFVDYFPFGAGIGNYRALFFEYYNPYSSELGKVSNAGDNSFSIIIAETGIVGIILFCYIIFKLFEILNDIQKFEKKYNYNDMAHFVKALRISYISILISFVTLSIYYNYQFWMLLGIILSFVKVTIEKKYTKNIKFYEIR